VQDGIQSIAVSCGELDLDGFSSAHDLRYSSTEEFPQRDQRECNRGIRYRREVPGLRANQTAMPIERCQMHTHWSLDVNGYWRRREYRVRRASSLDSLPQF